MNNVYLFQINRNLDSNNVIFDDYLTMCAKQKTLDPYIYELTWSGMCTSTNPEDVYRELTMNPPEELHGGISVSDVITIEDKNYYVDDFGFRCFEIT